MLHNLRHEPHVYKPERKKRERLWENSMTLCIAAIADGTPLKPPCIVLCADRRMEIPWAGSEGAFKMSWAALGFPALLAGDPSKAKDLMNTIGLALAEMGEGTRMSGSVLSALNAASLVYKKKLVDFYVMGKLGISFERFLKHGKKELTEDVRARILNGIEELDYECEAIIAGFIEGRPRLFHVESSGEVMEYQNFIAIGTGAVIAKATLYQREQCTTDSLSATLYNVYEASVLAHHNAPGVGQIDEFLVLTPTDKSPDGIDVHAASPQCLKILQKTFEQFGPKPLLRPPRLNKKSLDRLDDVYQDYYGKGKKRAQKIEKKREIDERERKLLKGFR